MTDLQREYINLVSAFCAGYWYKTIDYFTTSFGESISFFAFEKIIIYNKKENEIKIKFITIKDTLVTPVYNTFFTILYFNSIIPDKYEFVNRDNGDMFKLFMNGNFIDTYSRGAELTFQNCESLMSKNSKFCFAGYNASLEFNAMSGVL